MSSLVASTQPIQLPMSVTVMVSRFDVMLDDGRGNRNIFVFHEQDGIEDENKVTRVFNPFTRGKVELAAALDGADKCTVGVCSKFLNHFTLQPVRHFPKEVYFKCSWNLNMKLVEDYIFNELIHHQGPRALFFTPFCMNYEMVARIGQRLKDIQFSRFGIHVKHIDSENRCCLRFFDNMFEIRIPLKWGILCEIQEGWH